MYPESNITNMIEGYKAALSKKNDRRAAEIRRFLLDRKVKINPDNTYERI